MIAWVALLLQSALANEAPECTVIQGAEALLPDGLATEQTVVVRGDVIAHVGAPPANLGDPEGDRVAWGARSCAFVDGTGQVLTPGFIEASTHVGLVEVRMASATADHDAEDGPFRSAFDPVDAYNPRSTVIPVTRLGGVTSAVISPRGGLLQGRSAWVDLSGRSQAQAVVRRDVGLHFDPTWGASRAQALSLLRDALDHARTYARHRADWQRQTAWPEGLTRRDLEALQPVLRRELPLVVHADRAADIEALLRLTRQEGIRMVVRGGAEAWLLADELAEADVPVVHRPLVYGPGTFDQVHARPDGAARLAQAGVRVILATTSTHNARLLRQYAGNAVREGMDHEAALQAITRVPAEVFGVGDRGALRPGAQANIVLWSDDPLEISTRLEAMWIGGTPIPLKSRQTELFKRYR